MKQLLMVAGFERYFQIARCLRDEDLRADRQPEHTQLDLEISFISDEEDIFRLTEELYRELATTVFPHYRIQQHPFPRMTYAESMRRYGCDKPDVRYGLELCDFSEAGRGAIPRNAGRRSPPRSPRRTWRTSTRSRAIRARCARTPTTWSATAGSCS